MSHISDQTPAGPDAPRATTADPYLHLERVDDPEVLGWVRERSAAALDRWTTGPEAEAELERARGILDASDRIAWPVLRGGWGYNVWRDAEHPRGLWRRAPWSVLSQRSPGVDDPAWEVLLDVDALAEEEGVAWVYSGTVVHRPRDRRALVRLSRGGADAVELREYDLAERRLLTAEEGGFRLGECKSQAGWYDEDTLVLCAPLGDDDATDSGYARLVRLWRRGTDPAEAPVVFSGERADVAVGAGLDTASGRLVVSRAPDFHSTETLWWPAGADPAAAPPLRMPVPGDCRVDARGGWVLLHPRTALTAAGREYPAGSLLAVPWAALERRPDELPEPSVLFTPEDGSAVDDVSWGRDRLLLTVLEGMTGHLRALRIPDAGAATDTDSDTASATASGVGPVEWPRLSVEGLPADVVVDVLSVDPHAGSGDGDGVGEQASPGPDDALLAVSGPVVPPSLVHLPPDGRARTVATGPERYDATGVVVTRHEAVSDDGTRVPYTVMRGPGAEGPRPTILYGYGGFEIAMRPTYAALRGALWLERGGTYVVAGIRGGGEFGPGWHEAALRERRPRAFEDFAAVARALVADGVATRDSLGATGGSNGGLLMGVMLTRYPELFAALVIAVPLLDMRRYHLLLAGASWVAEYGDPDGPDWDEFLAAYSPYQNVRPAAERRYPPVLLTSSTRDDRVHPGHARKMTAALEAAGQEVAYFENTEGGHAGAADNAQEALRAVLTYRYFAERLGL